MSRKTYSFSAIAIAAVAGLSFSNTESARAFVQDVAANTAQAAGAQVQQADPTQEFEIVPENIEFITQEVVQPLPAEEVAETPAPEATSAPNASSLNELVGMVDSSAGWDDQLQCLAGAVYFESRGEALSGQLAVAKVVINRSQDRRWPASYCGVVYQRAQFSFVRGGKMPRINTGSAAWQRAKAVAKIAHDDLWQSPADEAVYFHARHVSPRWSHRKTRVARIDTHIFYR